MIIIITRQQAIIRHAIIAMARGLTPTPGVIPRQMLYKDCHGAIQIRRDPNVLIVLKGHGISTINAQVAIRDMPHWKILFKHPHWGAFIFRRTFLLRKKL